MKKEFKRIQHMGRAVIGRGHFKKVKKIKGHTERTESLKYLIDSKLKLRLLELESKLKEVDQKNAWILESKLKLLDSKIKVLQSTYAKRDYLAVKAILDDIGKELKHV